MSTAITIPDHVRTEMAAQAGRETQAVAALRAFEITNDADYAEAGELVQGVKADFKRYDDERKKVTGPLNQVLDQVNDWFRPVLTSLRQSEAILKDKIAAYTMKQRAAQEAAMHAAAAAIQVGAPVNVTTLAPVAAPPPGVSVKEYWDFEIEEPNKVERQFCSPDPEKIRNAIPREVHPKLTPKMAGVRFFIAGRVTARRA